ncbi:ExbD/TolR family protein [Thalassotalea sp. PLHSN55]|uniref:ExbD/TolR family protein n=1 Tax=Thalassotalea sp. PLHSN55 TaxID=3435888 RepID=UPI003F84CC27
MKKRKLYQENNSEVDMTPMLDIVFILLIFFIVTTSFVREQGLLVNKPQTNKSSDNTSQNITIHINENNTVFFNNKAVDVSRIPARIENFLANQVTENVVLSPHVDTNYNKVVEVLDQIKLFSDLTVSMGTYSP